MTLPYPTTSMHTTVSAYITTPQDWLVQLMWADEWATVHGSSLPEWQQGYVYYNWEYDSLRADAELMASMLEGQQ